MLRSKRTLLSALLSVGLIAGLLAVTQVPASAQTVPNAVDLSMPEDNNWAGQSDWLNDRQDGQDTAAHLTAVASTDTERVLFYVCPDTITDPVDSTELGSCELIGTDSEARTPTATRPAGSPPIDEAYDVTWDITAAQEGNRDIVALACIGTGERIEGSNANCIAQIEEDVLVEDAQTDPTTAGEAGEFLSYSTAATPPAGPPTASTYQPFLHGASVPEDGFWFRATTSTGVDDIYYSIDGSYTGSDDEGDSADFGGDSIGGDCTLLSTSLSSKTWECEVQGAEINDDLEHLIALGDWNTGQILDIHYLVASERGTVTAVASFDTATAGSNPCATPDQAETNVNDSEQDAPANRTATNDWRGGGSGNEEDVIGCLVDRFGQLQGAPTAVTFESTGVATSGFSECGDTLHDHDGNGYYEHCHDTTTGGLVETEIDNYGLSTTNTVGQAGTQTVTFCTDAQNAIGTTSEATAPVGHGCADEAAASQDTVSKEWVNRPNHVHLVFDGTGDQTSQDSECHTGDQFKENVIGDRDVLTVCTFDQEDRPSTTNQTGAGRLQWSLRPSTAGQQTATRFDCANTQGQCPPGETDANGIAQVTIEAINEGTDIIQVDLVNDQGTSIATATVQKRVRRSQETPTSTPPPTVDRHDRSVKITKVKHVKLNRRSRALLIKGQVNSPDFESCATQVPIKVQIRKGGEWLTRKSDTTNDNGVFKVLIRDIQGKYRAVATKFVVEDPDNNVTNVCRKAADRKRHRH